MKSDSFRIENIVGSLIADLRKEHQLTQKQLAEILHISTSTLAHYEQGICIPPQNTMIIIADFFHVPVDYLLGRCANRIEYAHLSDKFCHEMSYGDVINLLIQMDQKERQYFYLGLKLIKKQ